MYSINVHQLLYVAITDSPKVDKYDREVAHCAHARYTSAVNY